MSVPAYAPVPTLVFLEATHTYSVNGRELVSVTQALTEAGLINTQWFTDESARRGSYVHAAIAMHSDGDLAEESLDPVLQPYFEAYLRFLMDTGFRVAGCEERVFNEHIGCAGTLDLRGAFLDDPPNLTNVLDIKTGIVPPHVGYQTAGYARLLPAGVQPIRRRWALNLRADATYRLDPLTTRSDEQVFLAALMVTQAKRGWL